MDARRTSEQGKRPGLATVTILAILATVLGVGTAVSAQDGPGTSCTGSTIVDFGEAFFGTEDNGNRLLSSGPTAREYPLTSPIPPGTYSVNAVSYDGYSTRELIPPQPAEQWFAQLVASDGDVLAITGTTADIEDNVVEAAWSGSIGQIILDRTAESIRVVHAAPGSPNVNSVRPVCIGLDAVGGSEPDVAASSVRVVYENSVSWPVELDCGSNRIDAAVGRSVDLRVGDLPPGAVCAISYTDVSTSCDVEVTDNAANTEFDDTVLLVTVPGAGGADIVVGLTCGDARVAAPTDPGTGDGADDDGDTAEPVVTVTPTPEITPEVRSATEIATPVDSNPSFTG